jgi:hypothetical protein
MASLLKKGKSWYCQFYWRNHRHTFAVGRLSEPQARAKATKAGEIVELLERGVIKLPEGVEVAAFVKYDGQPPAAVESQKVSQNIALGTLRDRFIDARRGGREKSTQKTTGTHFKHLVATLGERFPLSKLTRAGNLRHDDQEGSHHASHGLALGSRHRGARGRLPEQGTGLSERGRAAALPDAGGDRAADRCGRVD